MPPVPKNAACPNDSSPVYPNSRSNPMPTIAQIRMRLIVVSGNPKSGSTNGTATRPATTRPSTRNGRCPSVACIGLLPAYRAKQPVGTQHQDQCHHHEQHDVRVGGIDHRG